MGVKRIKEKFKKIFLAVTKYIEDLLIFSGLALIVGATFLLSKIIGMYVLGFILFALGVFFSRYPPRR